MEDGKSVDSPKLSVREKAKIQAQLGNIKQQTIKVLSGKQGDVQTLEPKDVGDESFGNRGTIYFKNCVGCEYVLNAPSVKVLIEGCKECKLTINGHIKTEILEIWRSDSFTLTINTPVKTLQADMCQSLSVHFEKADHLGNIVWAGIQEFKLKFSDSPDHSLSTGVDIMKAEVPDLNPETDQFIVRFFEGKLKQELVVRLDNGFPTTEREANDFDERAKANSERAEAYVRKLIAESKISITPKQEGEKPEAVKPSEEEQSKTAQPETGEKEADKEKEKEVVKDNAAPTPTEEEQKKKVDEERRKLAPERKPSKKPSRVYIGIDN